MNKKEIINFIEGNELDIQSYIASFFFTDSVYRVYANCKGFHGMSISPLIFKKEGVHCSQISSVKGVKAIANKVYQDYKSDKKSLDRRIKEHVALTSRLEIMFRGRNLSKLNEKELLQFFKRFLGVSDEWWQYGIVGEDKGAIIEDKIISKYGRKHGKQEAVDVWSILAQPENISVFAKERIDYFGLVHNYSRSRELDEPAFLRYRKKYFWVFTNYKESKEVTKERVIAKIKSDLGHIAALKEEVDAIKKESRVLGNKRRKILKTLSKEEKNDAYFAERYSYWGNARKHGMMKLAYFLFLIVNEIAARKKAGQVSRYSIGELVGLLENNARLSGDEIRRRDKGVIVEYGKTARMFYGRDAGDIFAAIDKKIPSNKTIRGLVACKGTKGKIVGRARVTLDPNIDFKKGEILVTSMTRSDYIYIMKRASAIITDEGGISCHAAIISREMKIPCIIGTRNATRVLKDGDKVEVDAYKGIVKKLTP